MAIWDCNKASAHEFQWREAVASVLILEPGRNLQPDGVVSDCRMPDYSEVLDEAIELYNEYRSPMARATLVDRTENAFQVRFEGPFCTTCCRDDYFEDLVYEFDELGVDIEPMRVQSIEQTGLETFVVDFAVGPESDALV